MKRLYARVILRLMLPALDLRAERRQRIADQVNREYAYARAPVLGPAQKDR
ncbi:hypothetical protein [Burkholderia cepacia]|uniref:hypothetical protein n=1 Tax=Burkholderia cepacia TaxID=292 RepID=UPI00158D0682|nr:hypothetical protein [Burkholderia cepacia]